MLVLKTSMILLISSFPMIVQILVLLSLVWNCSRFSKFESVAVACGTLVYMSAGALAQLGIADKLIFKFKYAESNVPDLWIVITITDFAAAISTIVALLKINRERNSGIK